MKFSKIRKSVRLTISWALTGNPDKTLNHRQTGMKVLSSRVAALQEVIPMSSVIFLNKCLDVLDFSPQTLDEKPLNTCVDKTAMPKSILTWKTVIGGQHVIFP